jgi:ABC-type polysaccharide/polyol phosphate export permease
MALASTSGKSRMNIEHRRSNSGRFRPAVILAQLPDVVAALLLLFVTALLSLQMRLQIPWGQPLGDEYQPSLLWMVIIFVVIASISVWAAAILPANTPAALVLGNAHPFRQFIVILATAAAAILILMPEVSPLQVGYFALSGVVLGVLCVVLPRRIYADFSKEMIFDCIHAVWKRRVLLQIWLSFNIQTRYKQRVLGILWIVLLPVATSLVLAFAFSQFMRVDIAVPFITFYMSALVAYNFFSNNLFSSTSAVLSRVGIITQVYFPREILVFLVLGETLIDFCFTFMAMLLINIAVGVYPNVNFIFLPLLFILLLLIVVGLMFLFSALTVIVRDIPQFLSVGLQLVFFLTPIIYPVEQFPDQFRFLFVLNPLAPLIQGFRDVITFNRTPDLVSLGFPIACALIFLSVGYAVFKALEDQMTDLL